MNEFNHIIERMIELHRRRYFLNENFYERKLREYCIRLMEAD